MAYLLQILVVVISLRIKLGANKQITQLALYTMIGPKQKSYLGSAVSITAEELAVRTSRFPM